MVSQLFVQLSAELFNSLDNILRHFPDNNSSFRPNRDDVLLVRRDSNLERKRSKTQAQEFSYLVNGSSMAVSDLVALSVIISPNFDLHVLSTLEG